VFFFISTSNNSFIISYYLFIFSYCTVLEAIKLYIQQDYPDIMTTHEIINIINIIIFACNETIFFTELII